MSLTLRNVASYQELMTFWDIDELYAAHEILDIQSDLEAEAHQRAKLERGLRR